MIEKRLKKLRKENEILQKDLAKELNLKQQTISLYESGKRQPDYETLQKIADFFDVSTDYLLGRTNQRQLTNNEKTINNIRQALQDDPDLLEFFDEMAERQDLQMFAKQCRELSPETIKRLIKISKIFEEEERQRHGG